MALIDSIILAGCMGMSGQQNDACTKALQAGAKQSGIEQNVNVFESNKSKEMDRLAHDWFGKDVLTATGGIAFITKAAVERKATIGLPNFGIFGSFSTEINSELIQLVVKWKF